jgi:hypothetical protein
MNPKAPFTEAHKPILDDALRHIFEARRLCEQGEACGLPVDQHKQMADQLEHFLTEYKVRFINPRPAVAVNKE